MHLTNIRLKKFTVFEDLEIRFSPGINVFVGANGTGKTHLMKVAYAACDITKTKQRFSEKLIQVFLPSGLALGRLVKRQSGRSRCLLEVKRKDAAYIRAEFASHVKAPDTSRVKITGAKRWESKPIKSAFIPVKEMLANAPGFGSLYSQRELHFEAIYNDILDRAYLPPRRGKPDSDRKKLLSILQEIMNGKVITREEEFFHKSRQGNLEFPLLAEGMRKLGLLWLLIQNGTLSRGTVLFWDEPETNLNPGLFRQLLKILLELQRMGVQIFLATHDYCILKELDLQKETTDKVAFHALYDEDGEIGCRTTDSYLDIEPNAIADTFSDLYDREIERSLKKHTYEDRHRKKYRDCVSKRGASPVFLKSDASDHA